VRAVALSAADFEVSNGRVSAYPESAIPHESLARTEAGWNKEIFAEEQIRGLVRQLFSPGANPPVQQVVFSSLERETDVRGLCSWVGEVLAEERPAEIAVIDESETGCQEPTAFSASSDGNRRHRSAPLRQFATPLHKNVGAFPARRTISDSVQSLSLCTYLSELRREFEYSIVSAPPSTVSSKAVEMTRFADGIVLVLSAQHTRRVTALKVRNGLSHVRLLGTVLMDREFPIPNSIYRRL
jgi:hypothetical protein